MLCNDCGFMIWGDEGEKYLVPWMNESRIVNKSRRKSIQPAVDSSQLSDFDESFLIRSRLLADLDYIVGDVTFATGSKQLNSKKKKSQKYASLASCLAPFGLKITRLCDDADPEATDPFVIHRIDVNPFEQIFPNALIAGDKEEKQHKQLIDERWEDWKSANVFFSHLTNPLWGQAPKAKQFETIEQVLSKPGSLTIAALPTGYGKTRIVQIATYLLRKNHLYCNDSSKSGWSKKDGDNGPTLIISPLVALMDDQREKWDVDLNERLENAGLSTIKSRFLTTGDLTRDPEKMEQLRNNEIDVLCCSPEDLMDPKRKRNHWLETFARMKVPFSMMVVDEAHIIGSWGASIRPQFQLLSLVKDRLLDRNPFLRVLLMSATISISEEKELIRLFSSGLNHKKMTGGKTTAIRIDKEGTRPDLYFEIKHHGNLKGDKEENRTVIESLSREMFNQLNEISLDINEDWNKMSNGTKFREGGNPSPILVYTPYPDDANGFLKKHATQIIADNTKQLVKTYTGKTSPISRQKRLNEFVNNEVRAMIATSAFGMGVDKPDVWLVSYFGMPYSLSDLYQGFGRAARQSEWDILGYRKSGFCKGVLFGKSRPFNPRMQLALTAERFWDMLNQNHSYVTENGYLVLDISSDVDQKFWTTLCDENIEYISQGDDEENEGEAMPEGQQYDMVQQHMKSNSVFDNDTWNKDYSKMKKIKELLSLRLWSIACLQRQGKIELLGFHPPVLFKQQGEPVLLRDCLDSNGYQGVIDQLQKQGSEGLKTPEGQNRLVVIKVNSDFMSFDDFKDGIRDGLSNLENRHNEGKKELDDFLKIARSDKQDGCFRQLFSKTIGLTSEPSCIDQIKENSTKSDNERKVIMPCSKCRMDDFFIERDLGPDIPMMSTGKIIRTIRDGKSMTSTQYGRKKQQIYDLVIKCNERIDYDQELFPDEVGGLYPIGGQPIANEYDLFSEYEKVGKVKIISKTQALIQTEYDVEWGSNSFVVVKNGEVIAHFATSL